MSHSKFSPSSAFRWLYCTGSVALEDQGPTPPASLPALTGTAAHDIAAKCLQNNTPASKYLGQCVGVEDDEFHEVHDIEVTERMVEGVQLYLDMVETYRTQFNIPYDVIIEETMQHPTEIDLGGTADLILAYPGDHLHVMDYKNGRGVVVEVEDNPQLMIYALLALYMYPDIEDVVFSIIQPNARHADGPIRTTNFTKDYLKNWECEVLLPTIDDIRMDRTKLDPGERCFFCKAKAFCPAVIERYEKMVETLPAKVEDINLPLPDHMTPVEVGRLLDISKELESWAKNVKVWAKKMMEYGVEIPGKRLAVHSRKEKFIDSPENHKKLIDLLGDSAYNKGVKDVRDLKALAEEKGIDVKELDSMIKIKTSYTIKEEETFAQLTDLTGEKE